ncbi:MAG: polysaccharide pyruvyl transferase family protein [Xenococcus sp. MO_188.B8]|nr:polysaccharide pyruvyl transferase family protein [Xenococcus sp. MO_188.B8]
MKILVAGWFSFEQMGATAGDLLTRDLVCDWLNDMGLDHEVAVASPFSGGVDWRTVNPEAYSHVVFVCGPFGNGWPVTDFLPRFSNCRLIGLNLSMLESLDSWNPFDLLLERDSSTTSRPDLTFLTQQTHVPVVGVVLVHPQTEYRSKAKHEMANAALQDLVASREMSAIPIDTRLDENSTGLRTSAEVESLIARMDLVLTTRLHGTVLALKNGVPALAIDPIAGGAKILRQAETIGWPIVFTADTVTDEALHKAFEYCLTDAARTKAKECCERARKNLTEVHETFVKEILDR